jgi:hypothetical protein
MKTLAFLSAVSMIAVLVSNAPPVQSQNSVDFERLNAQLLSMITNREASDADLLQAISRLGRVTEPPSFWVKIANDPRYTVKHRKRAIFALLRRHCSHSCWTCRELGDTISPGDWINESGIEKITAVTGWFPLVAKPGETVFKISVLGSDFYLRLLGEVDESVLFAYLRGRGQAISSNPEIVEYAFDDGYDDWLFNCKQVTH